MVRAAIGILMIRQTQKKVFGIATSVFAGLIVQLIVHQPLIALAAFSATLLLTLIILSRGIPLRVSFDRTHRELFGVDGYYRDQVAARHEIVSRTHTSKHVDI